MTSSAELLLAEQLRQAGIPFEIEYRFAPPRRWRADFFLVAWRSDDDSINVHALDGQVLVEIDGGGYIAGRHSRGKGMEADCEKASAAAILGYRVIRCTPRQVEDGRALEWIRAALGLALEECPDLDGCLERMATERVGHALRLAWLDSNDAYGSPLPPDLAHHLVARLSSDTDKPRGEPS